MKTIEATYRIVTPMFIGGADQSPSDGIRPPSFKGALRFWWRALNWGKYQNLSDLHKREAELFGSSVKGKTGGQGVFLLSIQELGRRTTLNDWPKSNTGAGFLAYGILESKGGKRGAPVPHKVGIVEGFKFTAQLKFRPCVTSVDVDSIHQAIELMGLMGGLGSRSRRGFGSLSLEREGKLLSLQEYKEKLSIVFNSSAKPGALTALNQECDYKILGSVQNARSALTNIGADYKDYRSNIKDDRLKRIAFGLPLQGIDEKTRRASPLFIHVQALEENQFVTLVSYLPANEFHHDQRYQNISFSSVKSFVGGLK